MPTWEELKAELSRISKRDEYKLFRPLLESLERMANAQATTPDVVSGVLDIVKHIQAEVRKGADPHELAKQAAAGFIQPEWHVEGNVNQANRDLFNQVFINVFDKNLSQLKQEMPDPAITVNVVLLVMTATEAQQLVVGEAFAQYPEPIYTEEFNQLNKLLTENNLTDWINSYGNAPQDWKPFRGSDQTIADLIAESLRDIEGVKKPLVPKFIDIRTLNEDTRPARRNLRDLRRDGCIVVMDVISIRHPVIQRAYRRSLLDAFPNVMIVRVAPTGGALQIVQQMIRFSEQIIDLEFYKRFNVDRDAKCDQVSDSLNLTRWLVRETPQLLPNDGKGQGDIRQEMYK